MHPGIVLHSAGPEGIEAHVYTMVQSGKLGIVANHFELADFRQRRRLLPEELLRNQLRYRNFRHIQFGKAIAPASRCGTFEN
jgi:hypothetical protein